MPRQLWSVTALGYNKRRGRKLFLSHFIEEAETDDSSSCMERSLVSTSHHSRCGHTDRRWSPAPTALRPKKGLAQSSSHEAASQASLGQPEDKARKGSQSATSRGVLGLGLLIPEYSGIGLRPLSYTRSDRPGPFLPSWRRKRRKASKHRKLPGIWHLSRSLPELSAPSAPGLLRHRQKVSQGPLRLSSGCEGEGSPSVSWASDGPVNEVVLGLGELLGKAKPMRAQRVVKKCMSELI